MKSGIVIYNGWLLFYFHLLKQNMVISGNKQTISSLILDLIRLLFLYGFSFNDDLDPPVMADFWWISILWNDIRWPLVSLYISRKTINLFRTWGYLRCPYGCSCNCYIRWSLDSVLFEKIIITLTLDPRLPLVSF